MRILQVTGSFHQGGSEKQAIQLARLLKKTDRHDVHLATLDYSGSLLTDDLKSEFPEIREFSLNSFFSFRFLRVIREFASYMSEKKIEVLHTHDFYSNILGMFAGRYARVPVRIASKRETKGLRTANQDRVERIAYRAATAVTVNAIAVEKYLYDKGVPEEKIHLIYNGIDLERLVPETKDRDEICKKLGLDPQYRFITLVANLRHSVKNQPMLIKCAKRLRDEWPDVKFVFAGEGERKRFLQDFASKLGVGEHCIFLDRCEHVPELLEVSEICVLTSYAEGFSNSILEYMAASRAVVATDVGGARECIEDGVTGYLVESDDDESMAKRIGELLSNRETCQSFGEAGRHVVEGRFSTEIQLQEAESLYRSLLS